MIIAGDRDDTTPTAQSFLPKVTDSRVCWCSVIHPLPAVRHAAGTIDLQDSALPGAVARLDGACRH